MADWVKKHMKLQTLMGVVKDHLSTGRAIAKHGPLTQIDLVVLRTTNHEDQAMQEEAVRSVLEVGSGSRLHVSHCIQVIMERLNRTRSWVVALKCLILIHRCLHEGGFMFQDQLSVYPAKGGHNYLNLSKFKDTSSPFTWAVSAWIRWHARFIEQWIQTARSTGCFLDIRDMDDESVCLEKLLSVSSQQLVSDVNAHHDLLQEASSLQVEQSVVTHALVKEGIRLVVAVTFSACEEIKLRLFEAQRRVASLEPSEALILLHICKKLSVESMTFTRLLESVKDCLLPNECSALEQVLLSDYDLMKLKQSFALASSSCNSISPEQLELNGKFALPWRSDSWSGSSSAVLEPTRQKPMSSFSWQKLPT